ncbi:MAG TPA: hypothetical protein VJM57_00620 [Thermodesulfobacteriota bacterium]|nr:hypothetical protein [Thermodesulfobacteriota bacterium]
MRYESDTTRFGAEREDWFKFRHRTRNNVLLREPERCWECGHVYISLYPLRACADHDGLEEI